MKKTKAFTIMAAITLSAVSTLFFNENSVNAAERTKPATFYVSQNGSDQNQGTSSSKPWKSFDRVNKEKFIPGDKILFQRGSEWKAQELKPQGNGVTISAYGNGADPKFEGEGKVSDVILLHNEQGWTISDLDISNKADGFTNQDKPSAENGTKLGDFRGIHVLGDEGGNLSNFKFDHLNVHDISGKVIWINAIGSSGNNLRKLRDGVYSNGGWDESKRTGGIVVECYKPKNNTPTVFHNVTLTNSNFHNVSYGAFTIKQWFGQGHPGWAMPAYEAKAPNYDSSRYHPHTNISVKHNYFDQSGAYNCDAVYLTSAKNSEVSDNVIKNCGTCGIELYADAFDTVQNNDVSGTRPKVGGADSNAIDADRRTNNVVFQYNYVHNNGDGFLICGFHYNSVVVRYNLLKDNTGINFRDSVDNGYVGIYNNIIYNTLKQNIQFSNRNGGRETWNYQNNIVYNVNPDTKTASYGGGNYSNNDYYGVNANTADKKAFKADPKFAVAKPNLPATGDTVEGRVSNFNDFKLQKNSPIANKGIAYVKDSKQLACDINNKDYAGQTVTAPVQLGLFQQLAEVKKPENPTKPTKPSKPTKPTKPTTPTKPEEPTQSGDSSSTGINVNGNTTPQISEPTTNVNNNSNSVTATQPSQSQTTQTQPSKPATNTNETNTIETTKTVTVKLAHNAYVYEKDGVTRVKAKTLKANKTVKLLNNGKKVKINGKEYYQIGKNAFIKAANVSHVKKLTHNAYVYNHKGKLVLKHNKRVLLKKNKKVTLKSKDKIYTINHKKFYRIGKNQYIKINNAR